MYLLSGDWKDDLSMLFQRASEDIVISSPYVTQRGVDFLLGNLSLSLRAAGTIRLLADLSPEYIIQGAVEPASLQQLVEEVSGVVIHHLPRVHAKVYVADFSQAIITSGNLTAGGLERNYEYGVATTELKSIHVIRDNVEQYADLGAVVNRKQLSAYSQAADRVRAAFKAQQQSTRQSAREEFEHAVQEVNDDLLRIRLSGRTVNATFAKTILYLLRKNAPMPTHDLHPHIQRIHPDICDDSVDRVIAGENYGKRWKHRVRSAQTYLKRKEKIKREDGRWKLVQES